MKNRLGCAFYSSIDELLTDDNIELVDIATRSCDHYAHAKKALLAGKNVLLEKPACINITQLNELLSMSNKEGLPRLFFRQNRRFEGGFTELKKIVDSGILGNVYEYRLCEYGYERRDDWQTLSKYEGGQMLNWGPHLIDHALCLMNSPVKKVASNLIQAAAGGDREDHFSINITCESGCYATVSVSGACAFASGRVYSAYGSKGAAEMANDVIHVRYIDPEQKLPSVVSDEATPANEWGASGTFKAVVTPNWMEKEIFVSVGDLSVFWTHLYYAFRGEKEFPIKDSEVMSLMQVITAAKETEIINVKDI